MRAVTRLLGLVAAGALITSSVQAQTCNGFSSLETAKMNIGANAWFYDGASEFGGQLNTRLGTSLFLGVGAGMVMPEGDGDSNLMFRGNLGLRKSTSSGIEWCPQAIVGYLSGDGFSNMDLGAGIGIGKPLSSSGSFVLVPFGHLAFIRSSFSVDDCPSGFDCDVSDTAFQFGAGLGFRFSNGMQISPQFKKATTEGSEVAFGATVSFPFGK